MTSPEYLLLLHIRTAAVRVTAVFMPVKTIPGQVHLTLHCLPGAVQLSGIDNPRSLHFKLDDDVLAFHGSAHFRLSESAAIGAAELLAALLQDEDRSAASGLNAVKSTSAAGQLLQRLRVTSPLHLDP